MKTTKITIDSSNLISDNNTTKTLGDLINFTLPSNYIILSETKDEYSNVSDIKYPNVEFVGHPKIKDGYANNFTTLDYLKIPLKVNMQSQPFSIQLEVITGKDTNNREIILSSNFGLVFGVRDRRFICSYSIDGISWVKEYVGCNLIRSNTKYLINIQWNGTIYNVSISNDDGKTYVTDIVFANTSGPYLDNIYLGVEVTNTNLNYPFGGIINLNECKLEISNNIIWKYIKEES